MRYEFRILDSNGRPWGFEVTRERALRRATQIGGTAQRNVFGTWQPLDLPALY